MSHIINQERNGLVEVDEAINTSSGNEGVVRCTICRTDWVIKNYSLIYALVSCYKCKPEQLTVNRQMTSQRSESNFSLQYQGFIS